ncbi:efflux RND transporter permease subunit [Lacibacterium aquatile]|uniref:Efflux RND transporter permease subunit n=1 Tax=Lacibacterium aquatile TaxID=1168082 RepID=A0ABW5DSN8_9PROT
MSDRFNLSALALRHQTLILFFIIISAIAGTLSFLNLGRAEDPDFTFKVMIVQANWPGATAQEMQSQVVDKIEKKLQELEFYDQTTSYTKPGETVIQVVLKDSTPPARVADQWYQVRKKVGDIKGTLPQGVIGPFFNDEFGDTFGVIYSFSADGFSDAELKQVVEDVRQRVLSVKSVNKVELYGVPDQKIFVEFSHRKLATLGLTAEQIFAALARSNSILPAGAVNLPTERVAVRLSSDTDSVEKVQQLPINTGDRILTLGDVADIRRGYEDPRTVAMRHNGQPVIGLGISMVKGGNIQVMGKALDIEMAKIKAELPVGIEVDAIALQPHVVQESVREFVQSLGEALAIVLAVSFLSLGLRTGIVVALSVPLVLAMTFLAMSIMGIDLHRISLGALIIALGLLVDDAIIAVEMMLLKLEEGFDRVKAATFAFTSTAFPMLTGTLVTAAGFVPVGFAKSAAGEYTNAIFWVTFVALVISWIVAVLFTPYLGYKLLPEIKAKEGHSHDTHTGRIYDSLRAVITWCVRWRKSVLVITFAVFVVAVVGFGLVQQQFFPSSSRPELIVDLRLPEGSSFAATEKAVKDLEGLLKDDKDISHYVAYIGQGTPRFYLALNVELRQPNFAQFVVMSKDLKSRPGIQERIFKAFEEDPRFANLRGRVEPLQNGPPVGFPVQFRVTGKDLEKLREISYQVRDIVRANPHTREVNLQWDQKTKVARLDVDQAKSRALGVDPTALSQTLGTLLNGAVITQYREGTELIDVVARAVPEERLALSGIQDINILTRGGAVALSQIAKVEYELEEPMIWRRKREPYIAVRADIRDSTQAPVVTGQILPAIQELQKTLPDGYRIETGGAVEESAKGQDSINAMMPVMLLLMVTILMLQLQSFSRLFMVLLTAPLGIIGVTAALLIFNMPFGFVAMLGTIALAGMIMRNAVILVDQIDQDIKSGEHPWDAIIMAAVRRSRPIFLTAAAAILAMIPLARSAFWGPMAVAIMGGLTVATVLTLMFVPALYAAWFRVKPPKGDEPASTDALERRADFRALSAPARSS